MAGLRLPASRFGAHAIVVLAVWPLHSAFLAMLEARRIPYFRVGWSQAAGGSAAGLVLLLPDLLLCAALALGVLWFLFSHLGTTPQLRGFRLKVLAEPVLLYSGLAFGVLLYYPGVSAQPMFRWFGELPAATIPAGLLAAILLGSWLLAAPRRAARLAAAIILIGVTAPAMVLVRGRIAGAFGKPSDLVVLGLDSVSQQDDVDALRRFIAERGGAWYEQPMTPGLMTNAVWASVLTMSPVREHGIFHTFQRLPEGTAPLLREATARGYRSVSVFPDQLTCAAGSEAGFDVDRSGPIGWRQLVLPIVENNTLLLPLLKPLLPRFWPSAAPPNHAGTFTYDLDRELREIFLAGRGQRPTLVMAHLTYLHHAAYPRYLDLTRAQIGRVLRAPARLARDRTFDWQAGDRAGDPIAIRSFKLARLQEAIASAAGATAFSKEGRLVLFSDHGDRRGITMENFAEPRFHRVVLATVGLPQRARDVPLSLIDIGTLAGLATRPPQEPAVEFTLAPPHMWPRLLERARLRWSGAVELDSRQLARVFATLEKSPR